MSKCKITIWDRAFDLSVVYECYSGEEVLESQKEAFAMLEDNEKEVVDSLTAVKKYVQKTGARQLKDDGIENPIRWRPPWMRTARWQDSWSASQRWYRS